MAIDPTVTATRTGTGSGRLLDLDLDGRRIGRYQLMAPLGAGGMGAVYRGRLAEEPLHDVAIKVISRERETHVRALKREFRLMSEFCHPNFVRIYDIYGEGSLWYLVMEFVDGDDFVSHVRGGDRPEARLEEAFCQLVQGVVALHRANRLHRDLKPSNVLVERITGRVVILDFGLLQVLDGEPLVPGSAIGTPNHMAPELLAGALPTPASDWYGVGTMLWQALTGQAPIAEGHHEMRRVLAERSDLPRPLADLCRELLEPDPERRPMGSELLQRLGLPSAALVADDDVFFGREQERSACWDAWQRVARDGLVRLELAGEPGAGKSALAERFLAELERTGEVWIVRGRCHANERIPFKAVDALLERLAVLCRTQRGFFDSASDRADRDLAATLFPSWRVLGCLAEVDTAQGAGQSGSALRSHAIAAIQRILARLSQIRPLVLFIDDLQWGDEDSAQVLAPLFTADHGPHVLLMWARREGAECGAFFSELQRLRGDRGSDQNGRITRIEIGPLPASWAARLAASAAGTSVDGAQLETIMAEARGNPLFIRQAARLALTEAVETGSFSLERSVRAQLMSLGPDERRFASLLAIASVPIPVRVALKAVGSTSSAGSVLADLRRAGLATVSPSASTSPGPEEDCIILYHERLRQPLAAELDADTRRALHVALALALRTSGDVRASTLATHFHAGGDVVLAGSYAEQAGCEAASALAFQAAVGHFRDALAWSEDDPVRRSGLRERLAEALFNAGHSAEAAGVFREAAAGVDRGRGLKLSLNELNAWFSAGHLDDALECARPMMNALDLRQPRRGMVMPAVLLRIMRLRLSRSVSRALDGVAPNAAADADSEVDDRTNLAWTLGTGSSMFLCQQGMYFALESLETSLRGSNARNIARGLAFLGGICVNLGPLFSGWGQRCLDAAERVALAERDSRLLGWCEIWMANSFLLRGDWAETVRRADHATELMEERCFGLSWECNTARCFATMALERRGDIREVEVRATTAVRDAKARGDLYGHVLFSLSWAFCRLLAGDVDTARELAREALHRWTKDSYTIQHFYGLRVLAYCDLYEGDARSARARLAAQWPAVRGSDVFVVPSAKLDALLIWTQAHAGGTTLSITRTAGSEGTAHGRFVAAWQAKSRAKARAASQSFGGLGMHLWADLAAMYGGDGTAGDRLNTAGVDDPERWLSVVAPQVPR